MGNDDKDELKKEGQAPLDLAFAQPRRDWRASAWEPPLLVIKMVNIDAGDGLTYESPSENLKRRVTIEDDRVEKAEQDLREARHRRDTIRHSWGDGFASNAEVKIIMADETEPMMPGGGRRPGSEPSTPDSTSTSLSKKDET